MDGTFMDYIIFALIGAVIIVSVSNLCEIIILNNAINDFIDFVYKVLHDDKHNF